MHCVNTVVGLSPGLKFRPVFLDQFLNDDDCKFVGAQCYASLTGQLVSKYLHAKTLTM